MTAKADFGLLGLAVMGRNLALNINDHGFSMAVWNRDQNTLQKFVAASAGRSIVGPSTLPEFVAALEKPRRVMMLVKAGKPVDDVLDQLVPLLEAGDIVIDGGNTHFADTRRREEALRAKGIAFVGMGVSGGEEGARRGPSLMPGGPEAAWKRPPAGVGANPPKARPRPWRPPRGPGGGRPLLKDVPHGNEVGRIQPNPRGFRLPAPVMGMGAPEIAD